MFGYEKVIYGLKFMAEHRHMQYDTFQKVMLQMGYDITLDEIHEQFRSSKIRDMSIFEGMARADLLCGATMIANAIIDEMSYSYIYDRFLAHDSNESIYHFIRIATGDPFYTKKNIDANLL